MRVTRKCVLFGTASHIASARSGSPAVSIKIHAVTTWRHGARGRTCHLERVLRNVNCGPIFLTARARARRKMASGSSVDKSSIDRRLFQQVYISPLEAVRDFFEALSELRAASVPSNDSNNARYTHNNVI